MRYDHYCFDLDGTLWDAIDSTVLAWNRVGARYRLRDVPLTRRDLEATTGQPIARCVSFLFGDTLPLEPGALIAEIEAEEAGCIAAGNVTIYTGVSETLADLSRSGPLSIVSNCQPWYLDRFFEISGMQAYFTSWDCHGRAGQDKGEMIRGLAAGHSLYVGDTLSDQQAARWAGVDFAYAAYGFGEADDYDICLRDFRELVA